jgi:peptidoglycan/LPS O-acetylase OafA/YrhL
MSFNIKKIENIKRISFRKDLVVLRAFAVLSVILYHAEIPLFKGGWLGVDVFFVISGYLISNIIISELNSNNFHFRKFYIKRAKRILPALFFTLLITIPLSYTLLNPLDLIEYSKSLISSLFFYSNYYFQGLDFYNSPSTKFMPLLHTWSLSIEEQFYIVFPLSVFLIFRYKKHYLVHVLLFASLASIYLNAFAYEVIKFYQIQFRLWEFLFGVLAMILSSNIRFKHLDKIGFILIIFSVIYFDDSWVGSIEGKLISVVGSVLILVSQNESSILEKLSSIKFIYRIGLISYSLYLLHQPIFSFARIYLSNSLLSESLLITAGLILFSLFIANYQYEYVEKRFINQKNNLELNFKYFFAFIFVISLTSFHGLNTDGAIYRFDEKNINFLQKYYSDSQRSGVSTEQCQNDSINPCVIINNSNNKKTVVIIGDSHLDTLSKFLFDNSNVFEFNLVISVKNGCPYAIISDPDNRITCFKEHEEGRVLNFIDKDSIVIYGGRFPRYLNGVDFRSNIGSVQDDVEEQNMVLNDIGENIEYFTEKAKALVLLYPVPELGIFPLEYYLYEYIDINEPIGYEMSYWDEYSYEINKYFDEYNKNNLYKVKTSKYFCDSYVKDKCVASFGKIMFYWDDDHLSYDGASIIGPEILEFIKKS